MHISAASLQVLDVLDRQSEGHLLHNLRDHLASVGVTRIADLLRWEALVHLALQDTAVVKPGMDMFHVHMGLHLLYFVLMMCRGI